MKQLRILTGRHAGVQLNLPQGRCEISAAETADVQILDWCSPSLFIEVTEGETMQIALEPMDAGAENLLSPLKDFLARRFGDVVICVGPKDGAWPSDLSLLDAMTQAAFPAPTAALADSAALPRGAQRRWVGGAAALLVMAAVLMMFRHSQSAEPVDDSAAGREPDAQQLAARVATLVAAAAGPDVRVEARGDSVLVTGIVSDAAQAAAVRRQLASLPAHRLVHDYAVATDLALRIAEAIALPGLSVRYAGNGRFEVAGAVADLPALQASVTKIAGDLAPLVKAVQVRSTALPAQAHLPISAVMESEGLSYVETRDGIKHLRTIDKPTPIGLQQP